MLVTSSEMKQKIKRREVICGSYIKTSLPAPASAPAPTPTPALTSNLHVQKFPAAPSQPPPLAAVVTACSPVGFIFKLKPRAALISST